MMIISKFPVYSMRLSIPGFVSICQLTLQRWFVQIISIHSILTFHDRSRHGQPDNGIDSDKVTKCRNKGKGRQKIACQWTGCLILLAIIGSRYGGLATKSVQCKDIGFLTMLEIALILVYKKKIRNHDMLLEWWGRFNSPYRTESLFLLFESNNYCYCNNDIELLIICYEW